VTGLYLNQYFWNKKALLTIGWGQASSWEAYGIFVHGNMAVPLIGVGAIGSAEVGQAPPMNSAPEALVRVNWTKNFYTVSEVQRSTEFWNTKADNTLMNHDALYIPFRQPGAKALYMQEFDYHRKPLPGTKDLWVRVNGTLNFSHYFDFRKGGEAFALAFYDWGMTPGGPAPMTRHHFHDDTPQQQLLKNETMLGMPFNPFGKVLTENNWQVYSAVDYQLQQSKELFFRGWYGGFTASYVPPQQNVFSQYYEARVYNVGPFKSHPIDQITIAVGLLQMSKPGARMIAAAQAQSGLYANTYNSTQLSIAPSYTTHIRAGIWWSGGFQYCVHPTIAPKVPNPLVFRTNLTMFW
jgi:porin